MKASRSARLRSHVRRRFARAQLRAANVGQGGEPAGWQLGEPIRRQRRRLRIRYRQLGHRRVLLSPAPYLGPARVLVAIGHFDCRRTARKLDEVVAALIPVSGLPTSDNHFYVRIWVNFAKATNTVTGHAAFLVGASTQDQSGTELRLGVSIPPGFATAMVDLNLQNHWAVGEAPRPRSRGGPRGPPGCDGCLRLEASSARLRTGPEGIPSHRPPPHLRCSRQHEEGEVTGDAGALQIRAAAEELLSNPDFRSEAQRRSLAFAGKDGAQLAASSVESLLPRGA